MKRTLALLLAAIMCLGMFAGCKGNGDKDPASTDNGTGTTAPVERVSRILPRWLSVIPHSTKSFLPSLRSPLMIRTLWS